MRRTVETFEAERTAPFPSLHWFEEVAARVNAHRSRFEHLGYADCVAEFSVPDAPGGPFVVQVTFEEFSVTDVRCPSASESHRADFRVEGPLAAWRAMIESIARNHGRPDLEQTLNYLTHMGVPLQLLSTDPVRRDLYFRYAQTLQEFFNESAALDTRFRE